MKGQSAELVATLDEKRDDGMMRSVMAMQYSVRVPACNERR